MWVPRSDPYVLLTAVGKRAMNINIVQLLKSSTVKNTSRSEECSVTSVREYKDILTLSVLDLKKNNFRKSERFCREF